MEESTPEVKNSSMSKALIGVILVIVIVLAAGAYEFTKTKSSSSMMPAPTTSQSANDVSPTSPAMKAQTAAYKDGEYTATGQYMSPGGEEQVGVDLTLKNGKIDAITFTPKATRPNSVKFQNLFASGYKAMVLGKNIDDVQLDEVSGSSLTPKGFNDAIAKIKEQAKS